MSRDTLNDLVLLIKSVVRLCAVPIPVPVAVAIAIAMPCLAEYENMEALLQLQLQLQFQLQFQLQLQLSSRENEMVVWGGWLHGIGRKVAITEVKMGRPEITENEREMVTRDDCFQWRYKCHVSFTLFNSFSFIVYIFY